MNLNHVFVKLKSKTSNTRNKIGDVRASDRRMSQPSSYIVLLGTLRFTERQRDGNVLRQRVN